MNTHPKKPSKNPIDPRHASLKIFNGLFFRSRNETHPTTAPIESPTKMDTIRPIIAKIGEVNNTRIS
jgi:hypothetical protein